MNAETKKLVDLIVGNADWSDADREQLAKLPVEKLNALAEIKKDNPSFEVALSKGEKPEAKVENAESPKAPAANNQPAPKPVSVEEYIASAPKQIAEVLHNGIGIYNEEKTKIVDAIMANEQNSFAKEELASKPLNELRKMAQLMAKKQDDSNNYRTPNYAGQAPVADNSQGEEVLEMPAMNFAAA